MLTYPLLTVKINTYRVKKAQNKRKTSTFNRFLMFHVKHWLKNSKKRVKNREANRNKGIGYTISKATKSYYKTCKDWAFKIKKLIVPRETRKLKL